MANQKLLLHNVLDNSNTIKTKMELFRSSGTGKYYIYRCSETFGVNQPTKSYELIATKEANENYHITEQGSPKHHYFYLACNDFRGNSFSIINSDYDDILQARMDTGPIVVIEDDAFPDNNAEFKLRTLNVNTNSNGCINFVLPEIPYETDTSVEAENMVYIIAYKNDTEIYQLQGAIATKNDIRFPDGMNILNVGIELYTNYHTNASLSDQTVELHIYAFKVSEIPNNCEDLFPYFFS